jgi:hypothetical protein
MINTMKLEINKINVGGGEELSKSTIIPLGLVVGGQEDGMRNVSKIVMVVLVGFAVLAASVGLASSVAGRSARVSGMMPEVVVRAEMPRLVMDEVVVRPASVSATADSPVNLN